LWLRQFVYGLTAGPGKRRFSRRVVFLAGSSGNCLPKSEMNATQTKSKPTVVAPCWDCGADTAGAHFCPACGHVQPLSAGVSYFAFLGLPEKLLVDDDALEQRFHTLSWKLHPDNFVRAGERERELSLERSSVLNDAYRTLRDPIARVEYLLGRAGLRKEGTSRQTAPPELLEEVFELNESLDELREARQAGGDTSGLLERLKQAERDFTTQLAASDEVLRGIFREWDAALEAGANEAERLALMSRMNETLNRRSYLRNLVGGVTQELAAD
jgi:molecular chaperone HscB